MQCENFILHFSSPSQFSPAFSEPHSPWVQNSGGEDSLEGVGSQSSAINTSQRNSQKMEADEALGPKASISAVLYANVTHPEWKTEFPCMIYIYFKYLYNVETDLFLYV